MTDPNTPATAGEPISHRTLRCGPVDLHVAECGPAGAPAVVLLHGWPQTGAIWAAVAQRLPGYRLVMPDLRGLGASSVPEGPYDKLTIAGDIATLVTDVLELPEAVLVGHDWGGVVAFYTAWLLGARARGLAVVDVTIPNDLGAGPDISQGGARWHHAFHRTALAEQLVAGNEDAYYNWFYDTLAARPEAIDAAARAHYLDSYRDPERTRAGFGYYRAIAEDVANARRVGLGGLGVPVLALGGDSSWGRRTEPLECLRHFATDVTGGLVAGSGHFVPEERPDDLAEALRGFLPRCFGPNGLGPSGLDTEGGPRA